MRVIEGVKRAMEVFDQKWIKIRRASKSTWTRHGKPVPAGILNSKTLAEENLKGFRLRNL